MKKNFTNAIRFFLVSVIATSGCKVNDHFSPAIKGTASVANISTLKTYLSKNLNVTEDEIAYDQNAHEFIIRKTVIMKEKQIQDNYRIANEYKHRNGIDN